LPERNVASVAVLHSGDRGPDRLGQARPRRVHGAVPIVGGHGVIVTGW
jgi:hypothetical protein